MSVFAKVSGPIDPSVLTYDGYTLNPGESVLVTDETNPANTAIYWVTNDGVLEPHADWELISPRFDLTLVSVITDGAVLSRWWVGRDGVGGAVNTIEECFEVDTSGFDRQFAELDAKYLTPRVLAGLSCPEDSDDYIYAKAQWDKHEEEAQVLRDLLAQAKAEAEAAQNG
jgi:hypothetical protein